MSRRRRRSRIALRLAISSRKLMASRMLVSCFMLIFPGLFFAYQFVVRLLPSLLTDQLMQQLSIGAGMFGSISGVYYFGYSLAHIPIAMLIEKYSPRSVISTSYITCGLLLFAFHNTTNFYLALVLRLLIGIVSSVGFVGSSKVALQWFAKEDYGVAFSFVFALALFGAVFSGEPMAALLDSYGSKTVVLALVGLSGILSFCTFLFLRSPDARDDQSGGAALGLKDVKTLVFSPAVLVLGSVSFSMVGLYNGFADLWGVRYITLNFSMPRSDAAFAVSSVFYGIMIGGPVLTYLGRKFGDGFIVACTGVLTAVIFYTVNLSDMELSKWFLAVCMFFMGILASYQVLVLSMCARIVSNRLATVAVSLLNCMNMLGGIAFHTSIGAGLDYLWDGTMRGEFRFYSAENFHIALLVIPAGALIGVLAVGIVLRMLRKNPVFHT